MEIRLKPIISASLASVSLARFLSYISHRRNRRLSESLITRITNIPPKQIEIQSRVSANLSGTKVNAPLIFSAASVTPPGGLTVISKEGNGTFDRQSEEMDLFFFLLIFGIDDYKGEGFARVSPGCILKLYRKGHGVA